MRWCDLTSWWVLRPSSASGDFLPASQQRALICWAQNNPVGESCCTLPHRICLKVVSLDNIFREKTLLTRIGNPVWWEMPWAGKGKKEDQRRSWCIELNRKTVQSTALQGRASHLSGSALGRPDWCHGQLPGSWVARGGDLAHQMNNTQFPLHPKWLFFSTRQSGHS